jgi:tetratricopeptide (TPR) repeat protein
MDDPARSHNTQGIALARQGRWAEAAACFQEALRLNSAFAPAHNNLANIFLFQGRFAEAVAHYQKALEYAPDDPEAWNNMSNAYQQAGHAVESETCARRALALRPNFAEAHNHLGIAVEAQGKLEDAVDHYQEGLRLRPEFPEALSNLGRLLRLQGRYDEAAACSQKAVLLNPDLVEAYVNLGNVFLQTGQFAQARAALQDAIRRRPRLVDVINLQGTLAMKEGRLDEAPAHFDEALRIQPDNADSHFSRGLALLLAGDLERGWPEYEWRWRVKEAQSLLVVAHARQRPFWNGSPLAGKTIYVHAEQGLGDTIQFLRYLPKVKNLGAKVIFACPEPLIPLVSHCAGFDRVIPLGPEMPECDEHTPLMNLPRIFGTTLASIPAQIPYVHADPALADHWRRELAGYPGRKIGIAWQGSPKNLHDALRSLPLRCFAPVARVPGVHLLSLQKGPGSEQIAALSGQFELTDLGSRLDTAGAFVDTAAVMMNLDLVITSDTAVAHLAGALGRPVWVALSYAPDWRWMLQREDSPWYPTMRLFRQTAVGRWDDVFGRMAAELSMLPATRPALSSVLIEVSPGELLDKIAILEIKKEHILDTAKLANITVEYETLSRSRDQAIGSSEELARLAGELKAVNLALWQIEDDLRDCEKGGDFGERFIELARSVYRTNDRRATIKRQINELLGSKIIEEKSYAEYESRPPGP